MEEHPDAKARREQYISHFTSNYQKEAHNTEVSINGDIKGKCGRAARLLHGAIGIATESGEILDQLKKHIYYDKELDKLNIAEEIGDVMWYVALLCNTLGIDLEEVMETNIHKLKVRYPEKFSTDKALNRDLKAEKETLGYIDKV